MTRRLGIGPAMIAGLMLFGISMVFIPIAQGATVTAATLLIMQQLFGDGAATIYQINQVSLRQAITPERLLGRVNASAYFLGLGGTLAGSLLGGLLGEMMGVRITLVLAALGTVLSTLWLIFSPVRRLRGTPAEPLTGG
jgi:predicted MFS family arabinose efflux permease